MTTKTKKKKKSQEEMPLYWDEENHKIVLNL